MSGTTYLLSLLVRQRMLLKDRFDARYPHAWLVWEPSARVKPASLADLVAGPTRLPSQLHAPVPTGVEAVCLPLLEPDGGTPVTIGRSPTCRITIDDMTFSREHARLHLTNGTWQVEVAPGSNTSTFVRNISLQPGERVALVNGCRMVAGSVELTFYERGRFQARLEAEEKRLAS